MQKNDSQNPRTPIPKSAGLLVLVGDGELNHSEQAFVSDITYVETEEGVHYPSLATDAYSRKFMGYEVRDDMRAESVVKALRRAARQRKTRRSLIHPSGRGLQYCSAIYQQELKRHGMTPSMKDGYDCYQNFLAERVNGILKQEFSLQMSHFKRPEELGSGICGYL